MKRILFSLFVPIFVCHLVIVANAQRKIRTVEHGKYRRYDITSEPIAVTGRWVDSMRFMNESQIWGDPDWLGKLCLEVKNISNKTIKEGEVDLIIPKQGSMTSDAALILIFPTSLPVLDADLRPTGKYQKVWPIKPGEYTNLCVRDTQLPMLELLKSYDVTDIAQVSMEFRSVHFDDGTGWFQGVRTREDSNRPGRWIPVPVESPAP